MISKDTPNPCISVASGKLSQALDNEWHHNEKRGGMGQTSLVESGSWGMERVPKAEGGLWFGEVSGMTCAQLFRIPGRGVIQA